ncbi:MAG: hypothetical protein AAGL89_13635 [Pseudomonadota bacterium]
MTAIDTFADYSRRIPTIKSSDWFIRIPLAAIIIQQGLWKIPDLALQAADYGLPVFAYFLAMFAEVAGGTAILLGGLIRNNWMTDLLTRLGGLAIAIVTAGVIIMIYFGPFIGWQLQGMLLAAGAFFLFRGNGDTKGRYVV